MSKVNRTPLKQLLNGMQIIIREQDIPYVFDDDAIIEELIKIHRRKDSKMLVSKLYEYEDKLDKEKFIFCLYFNFDENLKNIRTKLQKANENTITFNEYNKLLMEERYHIKAIQRIIELGKETDVYKIDFGTEELKDIEIISSKELFKGQRFSEKKKLERWNEFDKEIGNLGNGSIFILHQILLTDLLAIFPTEEIGLIVRLEILDNALVGKGEATFKELEELRKNNYEEYDRKVRLLKGNEYLDIFREKMIKHIRFIDIDKLLLLSAYRYEYCLEKKVNKEEDKELIRYILRYIDKKIVDRRKVFKGIVEDFEDDIEVEVEYSCEDLQKCRNRFVNNDYIKKSEIISMREDLLAGNISLEELNRPIANLLNLSKDEKEQIMPYNFINFIYGVNELKLTETEILKNLNLVSNSDLLNLISYLYDENHIGISSIIKLYNSKVIDSEVFKKFAKQNDISSEINLTNIHEKYLKIKVEGEEKEEDLTELKTLIEFYKIINLEDKNQEEIEEESNNVIYELAENFEGNDILFYYKHGLVTLQTVAEWSGANIIKKLYDESKITFEDIEKLNVPKELKQAVLSSRIMEKIEEYETEELLNIIYKGYLSERDILDIYKLAILNETYADEMLNRGIISVQTYLKISDIKKELLEQQAETKISEVISMDIRSFSLNIVEDEMEESELSIGYIPESKKENREKSEENIKDGKYNVSAKDSETLIDPNIRWEFLKALRCKLPKDKDLVNDNKINPFYNYEFFVIEGKNDNDIEKDTIVIGERFFKDKEKEEEFATSNATYIWQYKDYLVTRKILKNNQGKNKRTALKETTGVIYVANHRPGSWAVSLLYKIAQAKAGESFEKYKGTDKGATKVIEQLEKLYTHEELNKILDLAKIIDDDQKVIREDGQEIGIIYEVINEDKRIKSRGGEER